MTLTIGISILVIFLFGLGIAKRICRNPSTPEWISDSVIGSVYLPLLTGVFALAIAMLVNGFFKIYTGVVPALSVDTAAAALLATAIVLGLYLPRFRNWVFASTAKLQLVVSSPRSPHGVTTKHDSQPAGQHPAKLPREVA